MPVYDPFSNICANEYGIELLQFLKLLPAKLRAKFVLSPIDSILRVSEKCSCNRKDGVHSEQCYSDGGVLRDSEKALVRDVLLSGRDCLKIHSHIIENVNKYSEEVSSLNNLIIRLSEEQEKLRRELNDIKGLPIISVKLADE